MDPERGELESPSAGTGLETPGQQCPPNEGTWDQGRTTADGLLTAGVDSRGNHFFFFTERAKNTTTSADISSPTKHVGTRAGTAATPENAGTRQLVKRTSSLTPVEKERRHRFGTRL